MVSPIDGLLRLMLCWAQRAVGFLPAGATARVWKRATLPCRKEMALVRVPTDVVRKCVYPALTFFHPSTSDQVSPEVRVSSFKLLRAATLFTLMFFG